MMSDLDNFREHVRYWCRSHVPSRWRETQAGAPDGEFVRFQAAWFQELRQAGFAVPHWPEQWGGGMSVAEQVVLYQELAAHDAPSVVLGYVAINHAAATLLEAGTLEQRQRHLPAILDGELWSQGFSEPEAGSDLANLKTTAERDGESYVVRGQKLWSSWCKHADWCLLLARTDPSKPKRQGISYFLMDLRSDGIDVRPIRNAQGESHFCEIFLDDVVIPASNLVGPENGGWRVANATLSAERGMTALQLAERMGNGGFRWLLDMCATPHPSGYRPLDDPIVQDELASLETEITALRSLCRGAVERHERHTSDPADASVVKVFYSQLLQRMMDFGTRTAGIAAHATLQRSMSSGWESGAWMLDFIGSWEWTIAGGTTQIQKNIIGEHALGLPREPEPAA